MAIKNRFNIDFFEFSFLVEACIPNDYNDFLSLDWRYIPNYEDYIINCFGDVISLSRNIVRKNGNLQKIHCKALIPCKDNKGYLFLRLSNLGKIKSIKVHQLVAMTFLGHNPCGMKNIIDHIDENKLNNNHNNLQIISNRNNVVKSINKSNTTSTYTGVRYDKSRKKWRADITINNKLLFLGRFETELEASKSYQDKLKTI